MVEYHISLEEQNLFKNLPLSNRLKPANGYLILITVLQRPKLHHNRVMFGRSFVALQNFRSWCIRAFILYILQDDTLPAAKLSPCISGFSIGIAHYRRYYGWGITSPQLFSLHSKYLFILPPSNSADPDSMYYHFAILLLLRPFIKLRFVGSGVSPRDVCAQAADAITTLIRSYDNLYSLARTPSFVPYIALASSIEHLVIAATADISSSQSPAQESHQSHNYPPGSQVVQAAQDLKSLSSCHGFSKRGLDIVRFLAHHWDISSNQLGGNHKLNLSLGSPSSSAKDSPSRSALEKRPSEETETNMADIKSRCTMRTKSLNLFSPDMRETMPDVGPRSELALFSPFPMQGIPLLAGEEDDLLRKDGFERLPHWKGSEESETSEMHDEADR